MIRGMVEGKVMEMVPKVIIVGVGVLIGMVVGREIRIVPVVMVDGGGKG